MDNNTNQAFWMYAGIVIGLIVLAILVTFISGGFNTIGAWFNSAITGGTTKPTGW